MIEDLSSVLLPRDESLEKAALLLSENSLQIVLIVDEERKLLGTVTDGDIRRALLAGYSITASVELAIAFSTWRFWMCCIWISCLRRAISRLRDTSYSCSLSRMA